LAELPLIFPETLAPVKAVKDAPLPKKLDAVIEDAEAILPEAPESVSPAFDASDKAPVVVKDDLLAPLPN
jgi:hypothetical protein